MRESLKHAPMMVTEANSSRRTSPFASAEPQGFAASKDVGVQQREEFKLVVAIDAVAPLNPMVAARQRVDVVAGAQGFVPPPSENFSLISSWLRFSALAFQHGLPQLRGRYQTVCGHFRFEGQVVRQQPMMVGDAKLKGWRNHRDFIADQVPGKPLGPIW